RRILWKHSGALLTAVYSRCILKSNKRKDGSGYEHFDRQRKPSQRGKHRYYGGDLPGGSGEKGPSGRTGQPEREENRPLPGVSVLLWPRRAVCPEGRHGPAAGEGGPGRFAGVGFAYLLV